MPIAQDQLAQAFAQWQEANPNATDADMAQAMQQAGVSPLDLSLALGIDPNDGIQRYNDAIQQNPLSNPLTSNQSTVGNSLASGIGGFATDALGSAFSGSDNKKSGAGSDAIDFALQAFLPPGMGQAAVLFKSFLENFGFFKGDGVTATKLTPEQRIEQAYNLFQQSQQAPGDGIGGGTEGQDGRLIGMITQAESLGMDATPWRDQLSNQFGIDSVPGDAPEGYVKDGQGFLRDVATEGYWLMDKNGNPTKTTPPLVNVPMPKVGDAGGGGATVSTSGSTPSDSSGATVSENSDPTNGGESPWKYSNGKMTNVITGDVMDADPNVTYSEGGYYSSGEWSDTAGSPTNWMDIFSKDGVKGIIDVMSTLNKKPEDVAAEANVSLADVNKAIGDYNAQVDANNVVSTGDDNLVKQVDTGKTKGDSTVTTVITDPAKDPVKDVFPGIPGTPGTPGRDGRDGRDGKSGLLTSLVNSTPITSQLFKPELFKVENKVKGLFEMVMGARR
tara:strand:- start:652 stop:2157 length:1506 start_codon:yes stop_codon:yes gene_type:complete